MAIEMLRFSGVDGAPATFANTGYADVSVAGGTATIEDSWTPRYMPSIDMNGTATAGYALGFHDIPATDILAYDQPIRPVTIASAEAALFFFGAGETRQFSVVSMSDGSVMARSGPGGNANVYRSAAGVLAPGVPVVLSVYLTRDGTAGTFRVVVYNEDGVTVRLGADSGLLTGRNTGTAPITRVKSSQAKSSSSSTVVARHLFGAPRWDRAAMGVLPAFKPHAAYYLLDESTGNLRPVDLMMRKSDSTLALISGP